MAPERTAKTVGSRQVPRLGYPGRWSSVRWSPRCLPFRGKPPGLAPLTMASACQKIVRRSMVSANLFVEFQIRRLHDIHIGLDIRVDHLTEFLRGAAAGIDCHGLELRGHLR